ncbi:MAG: hypothetical protein EOO01_27425, partial [Chitinophagaceae bacterium]
MRKVTCFALLTILFIGCVTTTTKRKDPLIGNVEDLQKKLRGLIPAKGYNLNGTESSTNGKITSEIEVGITDGQFVPSDQNGVKALAQKIGRMVKQSLQDTNSYDVYKVMFFKVTESGGVTKRD